MAATFPPTMNPPVDLLFQQWRLKPRRDGSLALLKQLHAAFIQHVPFENVSKLLRIQAADSPDRALRRPEDYWGEHLEWGAGGTCFATTEAFRWLLSEVGLAARPVFCRLPREGSRAHAALIVDTEAGPWLADVGYALAAPVPIPGPGGVTGTTTVHYDLELRRRGPGAAVEVATVDFAGRRPRYQVEEAEVTPAAFEAAWRETFRADAAYMNRLALGRFGRGRRWIYQPPGSVVMMSRTGQRVDMVGPDPARALANRFRLPEEKIRQAIEILAGR